MKIENTRIFNIEGAFRGMRNPLDSWAKSDSEFGYFSFDEDISWDVAELYYNNPNWRNFDDEVDVQEAENEIEENQEWLIDNGILHFDVDTDINEYAFIGPSDLNLAQRLISAGPEHRKFLRQIIVSFDLTAPFYFWKEFDTYKVATVANSCSTMHKLAAYPIEIENFEIEDFHPDLIWWEDDSGDGNTPVYWEIKDEIEDHIFFLEKLRQKFIETKDKRYWKELVRWLPNGWLQKRTITMNYETLRSIWGQRHNHKLTEWHTFCDWIESLPYADDLITYGLKKE